MHGVIYKKIARNTLKSHFESAGIKFDRHTGRPVKPVYDQVKEQIVSYQRETKMGSTKVYETIVAHSIEDMLLRTISHRMVYNTMRNEGLLKYTRGAPVGKVTRCRYEANYADLIWHTDLHVFHGAYLIAFIDDFSRFIVHYEIITTKNAIVTSNVLKRALEKVNIPFSVWSDNGGEFKAEFHGVLIQNNIRKVLTEPYTPQQNGKCERFWATADCCADQDELKKWVDQYNTMPHTRLPEVIVLNRKTHLSPIQRYQPEFRWNSSIPPT